MAARKLANEVERCFKKVAEGVQAFEAIYEKIQQTSNPSQKEKLEDTLKKEIKKLQRSRDQIKAWAAMNDIKDKKPLLEHRKLIETQMEKFKAVEKEMKTKAYSKEGLALSSKLDPREKDKQEACQFLQEMVDDLEQQIERIEAEMETLNATVKKNKRDNSKAERIQEIERISERHKWHISKLELLLRALENGSLETDAVRELQDGIKYYVENNQEVDFMEDEEIYDELNLTEEEDLYGMANEVDRVSSQDNQSVNDETPELEPRPASIGAGKSKGQSSSETPGTSVRRPSTQLKSPLPALATLHTTPSASNGSQSNNMKPAPPPTRMPGEPLKYASAAAAAAASDRNGVGIAPLPPPPGLASLSQGSRPSASASPAPSHIQPATIGSQRPGAMASGSHEGLSSVSLASKSPALSQISAVPPSTESGSLPVTPAMRKVEGVKQKASAEESKQSTPNRKSAPEKPKEAPPSTAPTATNGDSHDEDDGAIYHLPSSLRDLVDSFEATRKEISSATSKGIDERLLASSQASGPDSADAERPRHYKPLHHYPFTPHHYPQEPLSIFDDPRLYTRIETDALFYAFYYRQGTYQQFLAAKALKQQSWRFHKQYQTWFQRHEEPKSITEDYEQGTYRFFDYESTWMNRRKADFKFAYKWLEDEVL